MSQETGKKLAYRGMCGLDCDDVRMYLRWDASPTWLLPLAGYREA